MNLFGLSPGELLLIMMVAMVVLGPEKLPEVAASLGKWIREFRRATEELTTQFAGDNPLLEIQRALSLTDDPVPATPAHEVVPEAAPESPASELPAATIAPTLEVAGPVHSDYFLFPQTYESIGEAWTHGAPVNGIHRNGRNGHTMRAEIGSLAEEWTYGVPVRRPAVAVDDATASVEEPSLAEEASPEPSESQYVERSEPEVTPLDGTVAVPVSAAAGDGREGDRT